MIPRLMSKDEIREIVSAVSTSLADAIEVFDVHYEPAGRVHPHFVIENREYWKVAKVVAAIKRDVDAVLKSKIAQLEADV